MSNPRSAEEWLHACWFAEHLQPPSRGLCITCARAFAAQETAALQASEQRAWDAVKHTNEACNALQRRVEALEHAIRCYKSALATGTVCLTGGVCQAPERDHRHWAQVEYLNLQQLIAALRGGGTG